MAWQVLYCQGQGCHDLTEWELNAAATVDVGGEADAGEDFVEKDTESTGHSSLPEETLEAKPLTGLVDSCVEISELQKSIQAEFGRENVPGSDIEQQVESYISGDIQEPYASHPDDYTYVVWKVKADGSANQSWKLWIEQNPEIKNPEGEPVQGGVVGYKNQEDADGSFEINDEPSLSDSGYVDITPEGEDYSTAESWKTRFYVVTSYPKEQAETALLENEIKLKAEPYDGDEEAKEAGSVVKEAALLDEADALPDEGEDGSGKVSAAEGNPDEENNVAILKKANSFILCAVKC